MSDRDVVYYCVVDTRAELRDPAPLFKTNVEGLRNVLDVAVHANLQRFVFLSTIGTIAVGRNGETVDEDTPFNWADEAGGYIASRREAEAPGARPMPPITACPRWWPTCRTRTGRPIGNRGKGCSSSSPRWARMPIYIRGVGSEVVGIDDVADALLLAAERGRIGQRYIISERYMSQRELVTCAAQAVGARPPRLGIPMAVMYGLGWVNDALGALLRRDFPMSRQSARLVELTSPASHDKATRELGWHPTPTEDFIRRAARTYVERSVPAG